MRHREFRNRARRINERTPVGLILLVVGGALLAREAGVQFPHWLFTWEMLVIVVGLTIGLVNRFRDFGWIIITGIGLFFLMDDVYPVIKHYIWPVIIIVLGLYIILKPQQKKTMIIADNAVAAEPQVITNVTVDTGTEAQAIKDDMLDLVAVFGAIKKIVISKNFRGGEVVCVFGGSEINLTQADFRGTIKLEVVAIFGGVKLIVPANWHVRADTAAVLGGIDDNRDPAAYANSDKVLVLDGAVICGGIEITSY